MGSCLSCQRRQKSSEREPLLPTHRDNAPSAHHRPPEPLLYKLADIVGALQKCKLPSQEQLNAIFQTTLKSSLLRADAHAVSGRGSLSQSGRRVLKDTRAMIKAVLQIGMEKNADDKFQDLMYQCSQIRGMPVHIEEDAATEIGHESLSQLHAQTPSPAELSSDASLLIASLPSLLRLILTSAFFRLLLSDIRRLLAGFAGEVASVAAEVQVAAEEIAQAADTEWFCVLQAKADAAAQAVRDIDPKAEAEATAKDIFVARVQELIVRAQQDPQTLSALRIIRSIISKYTRKLSRASNIISNVTVSSSTADPRPATSEIIVTAPETLQTLDDLKLLLERLASDHSLDPLLRSISDTVHDVLDLSSHLENENLRNFFHDLDTFLQRALAPSQPSSSQKQPPEKRDLYVTSRAGKRVLERLYDRGKLIFLLQNTTPNGQDVKPKWHTSFQTLLREYDAYISALHSDRSTAKLVRTVDKLCASGSDFLGLGLDVGVASANRKMQSRVEIMRDLVGWVIPRMGKLFLRLVPIPRLEFQTGKVEGALEFGFAGAGVVQVESELMPDNVVLRSWNEIRADLVPASEARDDEGLGVRTSSSSRIHIHVEGVRFSAHDVGYFVRYNGHWPCVEYLDQGLVSVDVGLSSTGGLGIDIELEIDSPAEPMAKDDHGGQRPQPFRVVQVKSALPGLAFTLSKSKHYILNKLFVQPLAGPLVSKIVTGVLEEQVNKALVGLAKAWGEVKEEVESKRDQMERESDGLGDYMEPLVKMIMASLREEDDELESHTKVTAKGLVHVRASVAQDQGTPAEHEQGQEEEEMAIAVGAGAQLFPDKAGAYGEDEARLSLDNIAGQVVNGAEMMINETREAVNNVAELRKEVEGAERRRKKRVRFEGIHSEDGGWRSDVFDI